MVNFPTHVPDCDSHNSALLNFFISYDAIICSTMAYAPLRNSNHVIVSVSIDFWSNSRRDTLFHRIAMTILLEQSSWSFEKRFLGEYTKLSSSQFCEYFQDETDVCIHRRKYQVIPHSFS